MEIIRRVYHRYCGGISLIDKNLVGRIGWSLPLATIILTTTIHLVTGNYRAFPFFISEADYPGLERIVFKVGFSVAGIVLIYVSWLLFTTCKDRSRWYWIYFSLIIGVIVGANLTMMAIWDIYRFEKLHVFTASNVFQFGLAWGIVTHLALKDASQKSKNLP